MSAFIVSRKTIQYLVTAAIQYDVISRLDADEIGQYLWNENIKSVSYRYRSDEVKDLPGPIGENYQYKHCILPIESAVVIKQCHCYSYQSCEHFTWEKSRAKEIIDEIESAAVRSLPGYDKAPWGID